MHITIKAIGREKSSALKELTDEYLKRLPWDIKTVEKICEKNLSAAELKEAEAQLLLDGLPPSGNFKIALDENGKQLSSKEFAQMLTQKYEQGFKSFTFLIGGAYGHGTAVTKNADFTLSLGKMTFAHKMVRLLLIEQIYRAYTIITNHPYHK
jgi:23S rRNA (pseudouridine1915-N3)-methyltransferase